jgi:ketosteroid isomerase-like protein
MGLLCFPAVDHLAESCLTKDGTHLTLWSDGATCVLCRPVVTRGACHAKSRRLLPDARAGEDSQPALLGGGFRALQSVLVAHRRGDYFGGWGAYEKGWEQVGPRLDWAAARFLEGHRSIELLSKALSGDLAYTVWIERGETRVVGSDELRPSGLRVSHIFRREEGAWKIIHRHADAIMEKIEATAVSRQ